MELEVKAYQLPDNITFNYDELKNMLQGKVSMYETIVYTDNQIKQAKDDKANLNKLKKSLNDKRISMEKEYMIPFNAFKSQVNEIISIIDKPVSIIDSQVKAFEEKQKQDKHNAISEMWNKCYVPEGLTLERIFDQKWLNASVSMKQVQFDIDNLLYKFNEDMQTLSKLPEYAFEAQQMYISSLDMNKSLNESYRLADVAKKKAEYEAEQEKRKAEYEAEQERKRAEQEAQATEQEVQEPAKEEAPEMLIEKKSVFMQLELTDIEYSELCEYLTSKCISFSRI